MRGWQSLCVLSRFVTTSIAQDVCDKTFLALEKEMIHNQIRYFIEIFTLQFARTHPAIFCKSFVKHILRRDLSLQMISSLMIVGGNLIVGRYQDDFFRDNREGIDIKLVLAAVIPWLSSTQGFSRAIAQLLTHKLIPLAIDVSNREQCDPSSSDWYLRSVYLFLEENSEMKRLRKKQATFFHHYEADSVCTPEGVLSIPVDEGGESSPVHMIEVIKECLQCVYDEGHIEDAPTWRQKQHFDDSKPLEVNSANAHSNEIVNFQRKIIPIDALNLALESMREKKLRNAVGRKKQNLIVCATLIDKIPNLGGLTRTSEIFAADRLIVPDIRLTKMDNFKSLTVGAHEWIDIEECKEEVRFRFQFLSTYCKSNSNFAFRFLGCFRICLAGWEIEKRKDI